MLEKDFKVKWQNKLRAKSWIIVQLIPGAGVPTGFPDTMCLSPSGHVCFIEWKKSIKASHRPLQDYWIDILREYGYDATFVCPENVEEIFSRLEEHSG